MNEFRTRSDFDVELVDFVGSDARVVQAAKVSTLGAASSKEEDEKNTTRLINYLMREGHMSPFEHCVFTFRISAPIFVSREYVRHRIASINEESGRYRELDPVFYVPNRERKVKQIGKTGDYIFEEDSDLLDVAADQIDKVSLIAYNSYRTLVEAGVAKEVSRMVLPVNIYSTWYSTMNARALMNFLHLRTGETAMWEIKQVAYQMEEIFKNEMPKTYWFWCDYEGAVAKKWQK